MKERYQNPVIGDEVKLRLLSYNSNARANLDSITKVEIYFLDPTEVSETNLDGRRLVATVDDEDITPVEVGSYSVTVTLESELFTIGNYVDIWYVSVGQESVNIENNFTVYPSLWFTTPSPIVYDFNFAFRPNRIRAGEKRWLLIEVTPNVPSKSDLVAFYENLAITSPIKIYMEQECGECVPAEEDLRSVIEGEDVELREKCLGYYFLDTTEDGLDLKVGIYNLWFQIELGESTYISEKQQLKIV